MALSFFKQLQKRNRDFEIEIDGRKIAIKVVENERAKRMILRLMPGGDMLKLTTPGHVGDEDLEEFVARNRNWIVARLSRLPEKTIIKPGETILYKGVEHLILATGKLRGVVEVDQIEGRPVLKVPGDENAIGRKLENWLRQQARRELNMAVDRHVAKIDVRPKRIRITDTTSRWGSCSTTRTLSFSWRIIMAPPEVLDYLAAHEVAHLVEMNHSHRFWDLTRKLCPETDRLKNWLRVHGSRLHAVTT